MKIIKRKYALPSTTMHVFLIPSIVYLGLKLSNETIYREWLWPVAICTSFLVWFMANYKIKGEE